METPKQKAIREAYGEHWETVKQHVDENGYLHHPKGGEVTFDPFIGFMDEHQIYDAYRPKSIAGIEDNNGWITIEYELDLPKETKSYHVVYKDGSIIQHHFSISSDFDRILFLEEFTHWQEIQIPNPPIY